MMTAHQMSQLWIVFVILALYLAGLCREAKGRGTEEDASGHYSPGIGCREVASTISEPQGWLTHFASRQ